MLVPRMGEYLIQKGLINAENLQKALDYQQEEVAKGNSVMLGQALIDLQLIERAALDQAVTEQIIQLRSALQAANRTLERRVEDRTAEVENSRARFQALVEHSSEVVSLVDSHGLRTLLRTPIDFLLTMAAIAAVVA
mgnify:CR=1 FL=1